MGNGQWVFVAKGTHAKQVLNLWQLTILNSEF